MREVKEIWKWRYTLRELQKPCEGENREIEDKVFKVLKFSYDRLPNDRCRQCFLYCSLFPEDHEFDIEELIDCWICEGLINEPHSRQAELDKGNVILDELVHASLLFLSDWGEIKMHDVIRDMTRMNVKVGLQLQSVQVLKMLKIFPNSIPHCSKLKTLILEGFDTQEPSSCFFANMQNLNILSMKGVKLIPNSITNLGNLRVLIIKYCDNLVCLPSVAGLVNLWHLNISYNESLKEIPEGIERLVNLRVLDLSHNLNLKGSFSSVVAEKFFHLQGLHLGRSRVEVEPEALVSLEKLEMLTVHFFNLQKLNCYVKSGHWRRLLDYQICYGEQIVDDWEKGMFLKIMSFKADVEECKGVFDMFLPDDTQLLELIDWESPMFYHLKNPNFVNLQFLKFIRCKGRYLFTVELAQHLLHNVQYLSIECSDELEEIIGREEEWVNPINYINYPTIHLPKLKSLTLCFMIELRSMYRGRMVCPSLELVNIIECDELDRLPFCLEKESNMQNPTIILRSSYESGSLSRKWWDSLQWDDPNDKSMYLPTL